MGDLNGKYATCWEIKDGTILKVCVFLWEGKKKKEKLNVHTVCEFFPTLC